MRRLVASIVLWAALLGAASPVFACASAAAAGDCCPPGTTSGCRLIFEQLDFVATECVTSSTQQLPERDCSAANPVSIVGAVRAQVDLRHSSATDPAIVGPSLTDHSLTYLLTGRLRL